MSRIERLQNAQTAFENQTRDLQTRIVILNTDRDELEKKLHFEAGNSNRLEIDLDHARNQLQHFSNQQVSQRNNNLHIGAPCITVRF